MREFLKGVDPLCAQALAALLDHKEEDLFVDYKEGVDPTDDKQWIGLSTDVAAFANTGGGYIVFGVADSSFSRVGLSKEQVKILANTNLVTQKVNRHFRPAFTELRAKAFEVDGLMFVVWCIPESRGKTHLVVKDAKIRLLSGGEKILLRPGIIYVRRSGTNSIIEPEDFEAIIGRRLDYFRESLLERISKVVNAPPEREVIILDPGSVSKGGSGFALSGNPDAIPVKGLSYSVSPSSDLEEIAAYIALSGRDPEFSPNPKRLWYIFSKHPDLLLDRDQSRALAKFFLMADLPVFFWIRHLSRQTIESLLLEVLTEAKNISVKARVVHVGASMGKGFFSKVLSRMGDSKEKLDHRSRKFPAVPSSFFHPELLGEKAVLRAKSSRKGVIEELVKLAEELASKNEPIKAAKATAFDCYLYARTDKYKIRPLPAKAEEEVLLSGHV